MLVANSKGNGYFIAADSKGYIKDENNNIEIYTTEQVAGRVSYLLANAAGYNIDKTLSELIERIKIRFSLQNKDIALKIVGDTKCDQLAFFILDNKKENVQVEFSEKKYLENIEKNNETKKENVFFILLKNEDDEDEKTD